MHKKCILLVDDDPYIISALKRALRDEGCDIITAQNAADALYLLSKHKVHIVLSDDKMPGISGTEFLSIVRKKYPPVIRIMLTGQADLTSAMKAVNEGEIYRFFTKPWNEADLKIAVRLGFERYEKEEETRLLISKTKAQGEDLSDLENTFPGITDIKRDSSGAIVFDEMSDKEIASIKQELDEQRDFSQ